MLTVQEIPLSKLVASSTNMRKTNRKEGVTELAASIKAHGLLQNLTVRKGSGDTKGQYEVVAGGRRLAALQRLAKQSEIAEGARVPCHVLEDEAAEEISLAENFFQCPPHPADQYEAFAKLQREKKLTAAEIAARFGLSETVVKQRLKLGGVSPKLIKAYRAGEMTLDTLTAFTITDDRKAQERAWKALPRHQRHRRAILDALTEQQVPSDDRRARYVGVETYEAAGGAITRDLFDEGSAGYFADAGLVTRLARNKLQKYARKLLGEGWKWVSVDLDFDRELASTLRRIQPALSPEDEAKRQELEHRQDAVLASEGVDEDAAIEERDRIEAELNELDERETFRPEDVARAGCFVSLGSDGHPRVERGYLRKEDQVEMPSPQDSADAEVETSSAPSSRAMPEKLTRELTAARTMALRHELGEHPNVALIAVAHAFALRLFYPNEDRSCLELSLRSASLTRIDPALAESKAGSLVEQRHDAWAKQMPEDADALWPFLLALSDADRVALIAHCAALSVNAVQEGKQPATIANTLAQALALDMTAYWHPTVANYLGRVSKERLLEAVREGASVEAADNISGLKKHAMAEAAAQRLDGKGWLPPLLRG